MTNNLYIQFIAIALLSVFVHVVVGWAWTLGVGIVAGLWMVRRPVLAGALAVTGGWLLLIIYNVVVAPEATFEFWRVFGGLMGDLPGIITFVMTLLIGLLLGLVGALIGRQLRMLVWQDEPAEVRV